MDSLVESRREAQDMETDPTWAAGTLLTAADGARVLYTPREAPQGDRPTY